MLGFLGFFCYSEFGKAAKERERERKKNFVSRDRHKEGILISKTVVDLVVKKNSVVFWSLEGKGCRNDSRFFRFSLSRRPILLYRTEKFSLPSRWTIRAC